MKKISRVLLLWCCFFAPAVAAVAQYAGDFRGLMEVNGTQLYVVKEGKGEPLLIIHGGPGLNMTYMEPWLAPLKKKYTLIFFDQRSMGQSALSVKDSMDLPVFARDIEAIRTKLGVGPVHVLTHSFGSFFGIYYAANYPESVTSLIMMSPVPLTQTYDRSMGAAMQVKVIPTDSAKRAAILQSGRIQQNDITAARELLQLSVKLVFCDTIAAQKFSVILPDNYFIATLSYQGFGDPRKRHDMIALRAAVRCPVTVIHGACDIAPLAASAEVADLGKLILMENAGHYPFIEQAKDTRKIIRKSLKSPPLAN
jgi:proline iminopeptidase